MRAACFLPVLVVAAWLQAGALARAQQRPLTTEDPEVIGDGRLLIEAGVETGSNAWYPLSGLHGDRFAVPVGRLSRAWPLCRVAARHRVQLARHRQPGRRAAGVSRAGRHHAHLRHRRHDRRDQASGVRRGPPSSIDWRAFRDATAQRLQRERPRPRHHRFLFQHPGRQRRSARSASSATPASEFWGTRSSRRSSPTRFAAACPSRTPSRGPSTSSARSGARRCGSRPSRRLAPSHSEKFARACATCAGGCGLTAASCLASRNGHLTSASSPA